MNQMMLLKTIIFQLANEEYIIPIEQVRSIEKVNTITRVPGTPNFVKGVINLRGIIIPLIELRKRFDLEEVAFTEDTRVIIVTVDEIEIGLIVDAATGVIDVPVEALEAQVSIAASQQNGFIKGIAKVEDRLLILLNLEKVLHMEDIAEGTGS